MLTLHDMVANETISDDGADVLRGVGAAGRPFLVYAGPRNAGKTTLVQAILAEAPADLPRQDFFGTDAEVTSLSAAPRRGYLVVGEIGHRGGPGYLAGEEAIRLFQLLANGYSVASSLHAESVDEVFDVLARNGVASDAAAATVHYLIKIRALGDPGDPATRRVVEQIHEVAPLDGGEHTRSLLYKGDAVRASRQASGPRARVRVHALE